MSKSVAERWVGVPDLADYLGVSSVTVYRWLEAGTVPAHRVGKLWRFKTSEVDAWVCSGGASSSLKQKKQKKKSGVKRGS